MLFDTDHFALRRADNGSYVLLSSWRAHVCRVTPHRNHRWLRDDSCYFSAPQMRRVLSRPDEWCPLPLLWSESLEEPFSEQERELSRHGFVRQQPGRWRRLDGLELGFDEEGGSVQPVELGGALLRLPRSLPLALAQLRALLPLEDVLLAAQSSTTAGRVLGTLDTAPPPATLDALLASTEIVEEGSRARLLARVWEPRQLKTRPTPRRTHSRDDSSTFPHERFA